MWPYSNRKPFLGADAVDLWANWRVIGGGWKWRLAKQMPPSGQSGNIQSYQQQKIRLGQSGREKQSTTFGVVKGFQRRDVTNEPLHQHIVKETVPQTAVSSPAVLSHCAHVLQGDLASGSVPGLKTTTQEKSWDSVGLLLIWRALASVFTSTSFCPAPKSTRRFQCPSISMHCTLWAPLMLLSNVQEKKHT